MNNPEARKYCPKILIAEDDIVNQRLFFYFLKEVSENLLFAADGKEAVKMYAENPDVCIILMDLQMPIMNGFEAAARIHEINPDVKVIALSAYARDESKWETTSNEFAEYISKPIRKDILHETILKYIIPGSGNNTKTP